jgi:energy-coupling factor transporter ATPase
MSIIKVDNLIFDYNRISDDGTEIKQRAIDGVSLEIEAGSFVAIVGQNGSGKSTLAKCLNGLLVPSEGDVTVFDMNTKDDNTIWDLRSRIAMVFQNPDNQIVNSIVEDDVAFGPENLGVDPLEIRQRVESALKEVGMYELRNKGAHMLSGGQKQRVAIAGAVAMKPDCIVFDEPTAMLDPLGRSQVMKIIKELNEQGITIVLITHFMQEAFRADRIVVMKEGKIFCDKTPAELFGNEELIMGAGLEMPPAVDLRMRLVQRGVQIPNDIMTQEALVDYICR